MSPHAAFAAALLQPGPAPMGWRTADGSDLVRRFDVHRNNVVAGLTDLLHASFPVVQRLVGDDFFAAMAAAFVRRHPPRSPLLFEYGAAVPAWLETFPPAATLPYLPDVARLEWLLQRAAHAADATAEPAPQLAAALADVAALPALRARLHPSLAVLRARFAAVSLWRAHQQRTEQEEAAALAALDWARPEAALVLRATDDAPVVVALTPADAAFIEALRCGRTLGDALEAAGTGFDPAAALGVLLRHGALLGWQPPCTDAKEPRT